MVAETLCGSSARAQARSSPSSNARMTDAYGPSGSPWIVPASHSPVWTDAGSTTDTPTPWENSSWASDSAHPSSAHLDPQYAASPGRAERPPTDDTMTIRESGVDRSAGRTARVRCMAPPRLTSKSRFRSTAGVSSKAPASRIPALATTASSVPPVAARTRATAASTASRSVTSTTIGSTDPPNPARSEEVMGESTAVRSNPKTLQPHRARSSERASPIPLDEPVTIAVRMGRGYEGTGLWTWAAHYGPPPVSRTVAPP
jgi:hypothetical protein